MRSIAGPVFVVLFALAGCSNAPTATENTIEAVATETKPTKPFDGWGPFKFGMAFDDALNAHAGLRWEADSFRKCQDEMPLEGCTLSPSTEDSYVPLTAGIALLPRLYFNQDAKLVTINMQKILRGDIQPPQCERTHGQLLDYLIDEWGGRKPRQDASAGRLKRTTPKGRTYFRTAGTEGIFVAEVEDFNQQPDGRKITIISHYTPGSEYTEAQCWVGTYFEGPKSLPRPASKPIEEKIEDFEDAN